MTQQGALQHRTTHLSKFDAALRDEWVEKKRAEALQDYVSESAVLTRLEKLYKTNGSRGMSEFKAADIPYWDPILHHPYAVYHTLYLGIGKDFVRLVASRIGKVELKGQIWLPCKRPKDVESLLRARRRHIICRSKPDCIMVDFTAHLARMSMSEMQLLWEVGVPYFVHDLHNMGMPRQLTVMWLLIRYGQICFTRLDDNSRTDRVEYEQILKEGRASLILACAIAEQEFTKGGDGISQFWFTWKMHVATAHLEAQIRKCGHPIDGCDTWVEQMMRHDASMVVKCATGSLLLFFGT